MVLNRLSQPSHGLPQIPHIARGFRVGGHVPLVQTGSQIPIGGGRFNCECPSGFAFSVKFRYIDRMKVTCLLSLACLLLAGCATHSHTTAAPPAGPTLAEIQTMVQAHVSDSVIVSQIQNSTTRYHLTADQIISLKSAGVSEAVISALINTASKEPAQTTTVVQGSYAYPYPYAYPYAYVGPWPGFWWGWGWGPHYRHWR